MPENELKKTDTNPVPFPPIDVQDDTPPPFKRVEVEDMPPRTPTGEYDAYGEDEAPYVVEPTRRGRGCGCWIPMLLAATLAVALLVIGAILPPVNILQRLFGISLFGPNYTMLNAQANAVADNGLALIADPSTVGNTFGVVLASVPVNATSTDSE